MKAFKIFLVGLAVSFCLPLSAQNKTDENKNDDVPEHVQTKFSHEYPQTVDTEWKMVGDNYVVEFTTAGKGNHRVWYDKSGQKQSEERTLDMEKDLPAGVKDALNNRYDNYIVKNVSEVNRGGEKTYRVTMEWDGNQKDVVLNSDGEEIRN